MSILHRLAPLAAATLLVSAIRAQPPAPPVRLEPVLDNITAPVDLAEAPDGSGRLFVVDQIGLIYILDRTGRRLPHPFLDLRDRMVRLSPVYDERGLLGLAFHPDFPHNHRFFVFYSAPPAPDTPPGYDSVVRISEFRTAPDNPDRADPASERILLSIDQPQANHNGGQLAFGPEGLLYISVGDGGAANDTGFGHTPRLGNAQDTTNLLGTILRIDVDRDTPYAIPHDNPFVGDPGARNEIYAFGLRNVWRFSFDFPTGRLIAGDVGQILYEEVDIITRGGNYGWNIREGFHCFSTTDPGTPPDDCPRTGTRGEPLIDPVLEYPHRAPPGRIAGTSVIGGFIYRGQHLPHLRGKYVFGDYSSAFTRPDGVLLVATPTEKPPWPVRQLPVAGTPDGRLGRYLLALARDNRGELYVLTSRSLGPQGKTGAVFRLAPATRTTTTRPADP